MTQTFPVEPLPTEREQRAAVNRALRAEARASGQVTYEGFDCLRLHGGVRYTSSGCCVRCTIERARRLGR
jgi:hypothetical protein